MTSQASPLELGANVDQSDPIAEAQARGVRIVQHSLGELQSWKGPKVLYPGGAAGLKDAAEQAGIGVYVHAPYVMNVASTNNRIRIPSRKLLQQHLSAAAEIGARGLIVHGGHVTAEDDPAVGFENWFKAIDGLMTNFHLPRSTLFMLVSALMGLDVMQSAYAHAIGEGYRFYSYGDASLLLPKR